MAFLGDEASSAADVVDVTPEVATEAGEEVEMFAKFLDECAVSRGSTAEQRARIFKLVDNYYGYARETADVMQERLQLARESSGQRSERESSSMDVDEQLSSLPEATITEGAARNAQRWEEEAQTWDLLRRLLPLRYRDKPASVTDFQPRRSAIDKPPQTRREYWNDFVLSDTKARERKTVLEWLQTSASSAGADIDEVVRELQGKAARGEILSHGWLHSRSAIKQHKRLMGISTPLDPDNPALADSKLDLPQKLVTQLDPDVVTRQSGRKLAPEDAFFEQAIWLGCYELLRRGRSMAEIRDWCTERTEVWRAAALSALPLSSSGDDEDIPHFDCLSAVLWRRMCYRMAQEGTASASAHERAVYGLLSGDFATVEAVSTTWDDLTFAKYNADLRSQFDAYLIRQADDAAVHALLLQHGDIPVRHTDSRQLEERMRKAAKTPAKALQAAILEGKLEEHLFQQGALLAAHANADPTRPSKLIPLYDTSSSSSSSSAGDNRFFAPTDSHGLRILAHVEIVVSALDRLDGKTKMAVTPALGPFARRQQTAEHSVASYVSFLRLCGLEDLVPLYASKLSGDRCYVNMAFNLIHLEERDAQMRQLQLMRKLGLDAVKFVRMQPSLFLAEVPETPGVCPALDSFVLLQNGPPTLKYGRLLKPGIFGASADLAEDSDELVEVERSDELLIRALEWMLLVDGLLSEACDFGVRVYKYFLKNEHLTAARVLSARVPCSEIIRQKTPFGQNLSDENDPSWWDDVFSGKEVDPMEEVDGGTIFGSPGQLSRSEVMVYARPLYELECMVNALDCFETTALFSRLVANKPNHPSRDVAKTMDGNTKLLKGFMRPLLKDWLLGSDDPDYKLLRETYLPQAIIAFASTLQFAGTTASRDYLLECMELASVVAAPGGDVADVIVHTGRMRELVESFASCSKALAIWTGDLKRGAGGGSKKLRELGWSRELWTVKP